MPYNFTTPPPCPESLQEKQAKIVELWLICHQQQQALEKYKEQVSLNSTNSSKAPSSDSIRARETRKAKRKSPSSDDWKKRTLAYWKNARQGAQPGHKGHYRRGWAMEQLHELKVCACPQDCRHCQSKLGKTKLCSRKQVFDVLEGKLHVTEYQIQGSRCPRCKKWSRGLLPVGCPSGILGAGLLTWVVLLTGKYRLSRREAKEFLKDFLGLDVSLGCLSESERQVSDLLEIPVAEVGEKVRASQVVHCDETSHYFKGNLNWLWTAVTKEFSYFKVFDNRATRSAQLLLGDFFQGRIITDRYGAYGFIPKERRQYCWAHLKRDFKKLLLKAHPYESSLGACLLSSYRRFMLSYRKIREGTGEFQRWQRMFLNARQRLKEHLQEGGLLKTKTGAFCRKLWREWESLWHFVTDSAVEPTNNLAERQLRHGVLWRKKSFGTQSERGNRYVERMLTVVQTCRQKKRNTRNFIFNCIQSAWQQLPRPSLVINTISGSSYE